MKMTKEMHDKIVTNLYERYGNGEISYKQREILIQKANSRLITESFNNEEIHIDNNEDIIKPELENTNLTPKEKYNMFKESVYNKHIKGEITLEVREELLERAREKFFTYTE